MNDETRVSFNKISTSSRENGICEISETFKHEGISWSVEIYIVGEAEQSKDHCSIFLRSFSSITKASFSIKLVNVENETKSILRGLTIHSLESGEGIGWLTFTDTEHLLNPMNGFLFNDTITIDVKIKILTEINGSDTVPIHSISSAMRNLLFDKSTADYYIISMEVRNGSFHEIKEKFPVHKFILQLRSPVFKAMLSSAMKESTSNEIVISDFDHDVVREFISFLYLDKCDTTAFESKSLLAIAHKYEVKGLLIACENYLIKTVSDETAVELLQFADLYEAKDLKGKALNSIKTNFKALAKADRLKPLSLELLHDVINVLTDT